MFNKSQEKYSSSIFSILLVITLFFVSGCATQQVTEGEPEVIEVSEVDPFEGFNRSMYTFNDGFDSYLLGPISDGYRWIAPRFFQTGVSNFFNNLKGINVVLNDFMQGKGVQGAEDTGRFLVNSTIGLLGLFDVAELMGLEMHDEDFAQTLAVWGVPQGPYLVLPLLGPMTSRGVPGGIFDAAANPATYVGAPIQVLQVINARANAESELNLIKEAALDPYVFTRESFLQYRNNLITDGKIQDVDDLLEMDDDFIDDEVENTLIDVEDVSVKKIIDDKESVLAVPTNTSEETLIEIEN